MTLDLTEEETGALASLLSRTIGDDRYPLSPRIQILKGIFAKIRPEPAREPLPPPKVHAPPRAKGRCSSIPGRSALRENRGTLAAGRSPALAAEPSLDAGSRHGASALAAVRAAGQLDPRPVPGGAGLLALHHLRELRALLPEKRNRDHCPLR